MGFKERKDTFGGSIRHEERYYKVRHTGNVGRERPERLEQRENTTKIRKPP